MFDISLPRLINQTVRAQPLIPRCGWTATSGAGGTCATRCSRQCNQAKCAITHRVDLTSGHLVKLKTRHLCRTRSLQSITPIAPDWLRGELQPYKCYGEPLWEAWTSHSAFHINSQHPLHRCFHHRRSVPAERSGTSCLSYLPLTAISSWWRWNSVFRNPSNTCQNETGHLVPLPGEHSISRTCKYRGTCKENVSSTFLTQGKVGWTNNFSLCFTHCSPSSITCPTLQAPGLRWRRHR